jgi:hypothetical protein
MNKKQIEVEKDAAAMQRKKKMFMCIIHCLRSQHCLCVCVDDTYDAYASFEEIQHFTNAIERFVSCYLIFCLSLLNLS